MKVTRRDLLVWGAGAAAGLMVTPVPWKLLDDTSIWTQNWPWIPQPSRGPVEVQNTFCTLCPNGCGVRVRMAGGWPVGIAGVGSHPVSRGALCPLGFGAHQLNWHPQRLQSVRHRGGDSSWGEAQAAFAKACQGAPVIIIDGYPGRAASSLFQNFAQKHGGSYRVVFGSETRALLPYESWSEVPASALGYDLENVRMVVSFGAPLLDGWGAPGRFARLWAERTAGLSDPQLRLIQIEQSLSRTAARAWQWVPVRAGTEEALAAGLARVLLDEGLVPAAGPMPALTVAAAADQTGLTSDAIRDLARTMVSQAPVVAIARDEHPAIAALNIVLGCVGERGGIVRRSRDPRGNEKYVSADHEISSASAVLIDSSVPWDFVPHTDAEVFRFAAWDGGSRKADWLLPAPGFLEESTDIPSAPTSAIETYGLAASLVKPSHSVQSAAQFLGGFDAALSTIDKIIHTRCEELFRKRTGTVIGQETIPIENFASAQKFEEQLWKGAVWAGEAPHPEKLRCEVKEWPAPVAAAPPELWVSPWRAPVLPPLATKLYRESNLREAPEEKKA